MNYKPLSYGRIVAGVAIALYLKTGLLATAALFFKLYHSTEINFIYWLYAGFKAVGYYFGIWPYQLWVCLLFGGLVALPWWSWTRTWVSGVRGI